MVNLDVAELRLHLDLERKYVDFNVLRAALTVVRIVGDLGISLSEASKEGESRGGCPKCQKEKSFSLNINTNRFNCFAKGCNLKGGGVIDFFAKLYTVSAKEASHLLAFIYGIQPYSLGTLTDSDDSNDGKLSVITRVINQAAKKVESAPESREVPESVSKSSEVTEEPEDTGQTAAYLIASIKHNLAQLEQLLLLPKR